MHDTRQGSGNKGGCNLEYSEAQYALRLFMRYQPRAFIAKGETESSCGLCQLTAERISGKYPIDIKEQQF